MTPSEYLLSKGWRLVSSKGNKYDCKYWDHRDHQPSRRGCFTTTNAVIHQNFVDKWGTCSCLKQEDLHAL